MFAKDSKFAEGSFGNTATAFKPPLRTVGQKIFSYRGQLSSERYHHYAILDYCRSKGAVIKYEADRGGRDCTGPPKMLREECWVTKIFPTEKMGHEI